jgi:hypothetical protein
MLLPKEHLGWDPVTFSVDGSLGVRTWISGCRGCISSICSPQHESENWSCVSRGFSGIVSWRSRAQRWGWVASLTLSPGWGQRWMAMNGEEVTGSPSLFKFSIRGQWWTLAWVAVRTPYHPLGTPPWCPLASCCWGNGAMVPQLRIPNACLTAVSLSNLLFHSISQFSFIKNWLLREIMDTKLGVHFVFKLTETPMNLRKREFSSQNLQEDGLLMYAWKPPLSF